MGQRILLLLFVVSGFLVAPGAQAQYKADSAKIVTLLEEDYKTLANYDTIKHRLNCTYDYQLVEEGEVWNIDKEIDYISKIALSKASRTNEFFIRSVKISGSTAYAVYDLRSTITEEGNAKKYRWLESAIFRKVGNRWRIALIHSTRVERL
ncbi:nuclear transport factor 2 family protein [Flavihumibacter profundi]|uniref:nuclear transport factor 2 family protein n=1 Tax=Flavihumibacter profundi TaxID=2716883 RepID=UPI001CC71633|nr:nuclear transport factor 2 family protein [Flavihumibacter profundi]MBZ5857850.1 nuclear transport factor 2 family protein [Flavihumibacter profundi]